MTQPRKPAQVLLEARQKASQEKRAKVLAVVDELKANGGPITFLAVARAAGVSNWLVYADGVREHIEAARKSQAGNRGRERKEGAVASSASLATDLELARGQLRAVTEERDRLKAAVQRNLGVQVNAVQAKDLVARVQELTEANQLLASQLAAAEVERQRLERELAETQDDMISARAALGKMMRTQNRDG
ncbi:DUF6262 family protein [Kitasatospora sp. NPDC086801]|uniref:DUF6262 family protein n=1 Tax=Kitasatospora TaxID=2063 RepID=UPI00381D2320